MTTSEYLSSIRDTVSQFKNASNNHRFPRYIKETGDLGLQLADPIILRISNASKSAVSNFDLFNAGQYLTGGYDGGSWSPEGNLTIHDVTISSMTPGISYQQFLASTQNAPFNVAAIYLERISGPFQQVSDIYSLSCPSTNGELYLEGIKPFQDPNGVHNGITYNTVTFNIGSFTKLTLKTVYALAVFQISIFPANIIDHSMALSNSKTQHSRKRIIPN